MNHRRACPNGQLVVLTPRIIGSKVIIDIRELVMEFTKNRPA